LEYFLYNLAFFDGLHGHPASIGAGALIGVAAAGGEGALISGSVGVGARTAVAYFTGKRNIHLRAETPLTFRLEQPVTIDVNQSWPKHSSHEGSNLRVFREARVQPVIYGP
jgi:membrane protein DedA with SNARE-associated domain